MTGSNPGPQQHGDKHASGKNAVDDEKKIRAKLTDQGFNIRRYPDPLAQRQPSGPEAYPNGVTVEMEKRWLDAIRAAHADRE